MSKKNELSLVKAGMLEDLERSGLSLPHVRKLSLVPLTSEETHQVSELVAPSYRIPYFDTHKNDTGFFRLKFLLPPRRGRRELTDIRYWQPPDTLPHFYLPPFLDWAVISQNDSSIVITEGEKKAAAACAAKIPCLAVGGVWAWRAKKAGRPAVPDFDIFQWKRPVELCFDSDAQNNTQVVGALNALSSHLASLGAEVFLVKLPSGEGGIKTGLDDFLAAGGDFAALPREPHGLSAELWRLNGELALVRELNSVLDLETGALHRDVGRFARQAYGNRLVVYSDGGRLRKVNALEEWLKWPLRREHPSLTYSPGGEGVVENGALNTWKGWGCKPKKGSARPWLDLLELLFGADGAAQAWFEAWCAYPLQYPGAKLLVAAVLWSRRHGIGKSFVGQLLGDVYGRENFSEIGEAQLHSAYNDWAANKQFVLGDEVVNRASRSDVSALKALITRERIVVNQKYVPIYTLPDRANYLFTSNQPDAFYLEPGDRRFFVHEIKALTAPDDFYKQIDRWRRKGGAAALFYHLLNQVDCSEFNPKAPAPATAAKADMVWMGASALDEFSADLLADPVATLRTEGRVLTRDLFTLEELKCLLPEDVAGPGYHPRSFGKALRRAGFRCYLTKVGGSVLKLWAVRDPTGWEGRSHAERAAHYEKKLRVLETGRQREQRREAKVR